MAFGVAGRTRPPYTHLWKRPQRRWMPPVNVSPLVSKLIPREWEQFEDEAEVLSFRPSQKRNTGQHFEIIISLAVWRALKLATEVKCWVFEETKERLRNTLPISPGDAAWLTNPALGREYS
ncbi:hypothetical protein LTR72_006596 [Exophiala xenobiotica]|nr:hypothetical protein LTR41_005435 [Exophiala xenobiotica]KAK5221038.1 hypothetical protein LTR72_006596 [Exophiala xenobiotica]KAK5287273.1 hypothetical protein LTR14_009337 [Exophiala xenobiotica]KAK5475390.1 hypothetical protein LTR55_009394 [Exophiala xenobiotica]